MSELVREAFRQYERKSWWDEMNEFGRKTASAAGVKSEQNVVDAIHSVRHRKRK
jgi:hypothetical protein